jgi:cytochrome c2
MKSVRAWLVGAASVGALAAACAPKVSPVTAAAMAAHPRAGEIWSEKCGSCHVPVDPGTRTREALVAALAKHRARAKKISEAEWGELVDFLAAPPAATASAGDAPIRAR